MDLSLSVSAAEHPLDQRARTHSASPCWRAQGSPQWFLPAAQQWPGFSGGSVGKESTFSAGDAGLIPGLGRSPGDENGNPLQYSWLQNPMNREAWWASNHGVEQSWKPHNLNTHAKTLFPNRSHLHLLKVRF